MFESALIEHKLAKEEYDREEPALRARLLEAQLKLLEQKSCSVVIVVTGMDGAGKSEVIYRMMEWLDPRHVRVAAYGPPDDAERSRPRMWRYWRDLPPEATSPSSSAPGTAIRYAIGWSARAAKAGSSANSPPSTGLSRC